MNRTKKNEEENRQIYYPDTEKSLNLPISLESKLKSSLQKIPERSKVHVGTSQTLVMYKKKENKITHSYDHQMKKQQQQEKNFYISDGGLKKKIEKFNSYNSNINSNNNNGGTNLNNNGNCNSKTMRSIQSYPKTINTNGSAKHNYVMKNSFFSKENKEANNGGPKSSLNPNRKKDLNGGSNIQNNVFYKTVRESSKRPVFPNNNLNMGIKKKKHDINSLNNNINNQNNNDEEEKHMEIITSLIKGAYLSITKNKDKNQKPTIKELLNERKKSFLRKNGIRPSKISIDDDNSLNNNINKDIKNRIIPEENKNDDYSTKMSKTSTNFHINKLNKPSKSSRGFSPKYQNYLTLNNEKFFNDDKNKLTIKNKNGKKGLNKKPIVDQFEFIKKIQKEKKKMFLNDEDERNFLNTCSNEKFFDKKQRDKILSSEKDDAINNSFRKKNNSKKKENPTYESIKINNFMKLKNENPSSLVDVNNDEFPYSHKKSYRNPEELEKFLKDKKLKTKKINNENEMEKNKKLFVRYKNLYLLNSKWTSPDRSGNNFYNANTSNNSNNIILTNNNNTINKSNNYASNTINNINNSNSTNKYKNINGIINNNNKKKKSSSQNNYIKKKKEANEFWVGNDSFVRNNNSTLVDANDYYLNVLESQQLLVNSGFDKIKNPSDTESEKNYSLEEEKGNDNNQNGNYYNNTFNKNYSNQRNNEEKTTENNSSKVQIKKIPEKESIRKKGSEQNENVRIKNNNRIPISNKSNKSKSQEKALVQNNRNNINNHQNTLTKSSSNKSKSESKSKSREKDSKKKQSSTKNNLQGQSKNININIQNTNKNSNCNANSINLSPNKIPAQVIERTIKPTYVINLIEKLKLIIKQIVFNTLRQIFETQIKIDQYTIGFPFLVAILKIDAFRKLEEYCNYKTYYPVFRQFTLPYLRQSFRKLRMYYPPPVKHLKLFVAILSRLIKYKVLEKIYLYYRDVVEQTTIIKKFFFFAAYQNLHDAFLKIYLKAYRKESSDDDKAKNKGSDKNIKKSKENEDDNGLKDDDNSNNDGEGDNVIRFPQNNSLNDEKDNKDKVKDNKRYNEKNKNDERGKHFICLLGDAIEDAYNKDNEKKKDDKKPSSESIDSLISDSSNSKIKENEQNKNKKSSKEKDSDEVEVKEEEDIQENIQNSCDISAEKEENKSIDWDYNLSTSKDKRNQSNQSDEKPNKNISNENDDQNLKIEEELQIESLDDSMNNNDSKGKKNQNKDNKNYKKTLKKDKEPLLNANDDEYNYDFDEVDKALEKKEKELEKDNEDLMKISNSNNKNEQINNKTEKSRNKEKVKPKEEEKQIPFEFPPELKEKLDKMPQKQKEKFTNDLVKQIIQDLLKSEVCVGETKNKIIPHKLFRYESNDQLSNSQSGSAGNSGALAGNLRDNLTKELHLANIGELNLQDDDLMMLNDSLMSCYSAYSIFNRTVKDKKKEHSLNLYFKFIAPKLIKMIKHEIYLKYDEIYKNISTPLKNNSKGLMVSLTIQDADMLRDNYKCTSDNIKDISVLIDKENILKNFEPINKQIRSKDNVTSDNFYDKMLNECIVETAIELINKERIYGENGDPLIWSSRMHELEYQYPKTGPKKLADFIERGILKTLKNRIGLITDNYDYLNAEQINVERERRLLNSIKRELDDDEYQWRNLEMEETQIKIEVTEMIMEQLYNENIEILEHIQFSRNRPDLYQYKSIYDCEDIPKLSFQQTTTENVQQEGDDDN